jgi:hypothetical protein
MKVNQGQVTAAITTVRAAVGDDDAVAAAEALRLAKLSAPDAVAFLHNVVRAERAATVPQRVRASSLLLAVAGFLPESRVSGGLAEAEAADGGGDLSIAS